MNGTVRAGLGALCVAVAFALVWLALRPDETPALRSGVDQQSFADLFRGLALVSGVAGLAMIAKGLLRD